jgi:hypothetical protein
MHVEARKAELMKEHDSINQSLKPLKHGKTDSGVAQRTREEMWVCFVFAFHFLSIQPTGEATIGMRTQSPLRYRSGPLSSQNGIRT